MGASVSTPSATIAASATVSGQFYVGHGRLVSVEVPSGFTGTSISFEGSYDGSTFDPIYDYEGNLVSMTVAAGDLTPIGNTPYFEGALWMKIVAASTQSSPVTLSCLVRKNPIAKMS